jgi:MarR family 2-MHQ and catechol resistance regulon transcriptional repressor
MSTRYKGNPRELQSLNAFIKLKRASESLSSRLQHNLSNYNLTESQLGVLESLYHLGSMCQKELGTKILKSTGNITLIIDNLEKRDLVRRIRNTEDRRYFTIELTGEGKKLIGDFMPKHVKEIVKEFAILSNDELEVLQKLCKKIGLQTTD